LTDARQSVIIELNFEIQMTYTPVVRLVRMELVRRTGPRTSHSHEHEEGCEMGAQPESSDFEDKRDEPRRSGGESPEQPPVSFEEIAGLTLGTGAALRVWRQNKRGDLCMKERRWHEAVTAFQKVINSYNVGVSTASYFGISDIAPPCWAFYKLGLAFEQVPDLPRATEALEQAIAGDPENMLARIALARVVVERSDYNRALDELWKAYNFIQEHRDKHVKLEADKQACEILAYLGSLLICMGKLTEAETALERAISLNPENPRALANYAIIADAQGNEFDLRKYLGAALERVRRGVDDDLVNGLMHDAPNTKFGIIILQMLSKHHHITDDTFIRQSKEWQRRRDELHKQADAYYIDTAGGHVMPRGHNYDNNNSFIVNQGDECVGQQVNYTTSKLNVDLDKLVTELERVKSRMCSEATNPEHFHAIGEVESARRDAQNANQKGLSRHLKAAGQWALQIASTVGASMAETAIRAALNQPR
jgi:tetratricopeptide (TPR) repeat protein